MILASLGFLVVAALSPQGAYENGFCPIVSPDDVRLAETEWTRSDTTENGIELAMSQKKKVRWSCGLMGCSIAVRPNVTVIGRASFEGGAPVYYEIDRKSIIFALPGEPDRNGETGKMDCKVDPNPNG